MSLIEARDLTRRFGNVVAVDELTFAVDAGEIVGLLGANGAGKTTTMRMLLGLITPSGGSAAVAGMPAARADRRSMGYVPQGLGLYRELTVTENLEFTAAAFGVKTPSLETEDLGHIADRRVGDVSLGLRRRVAFLAARCHDPAVLVLDEPTSGVSPLGRARLWETIHETAEGGVAVLVSTHYMEEAEECDRIILMAGGRQVVSGTVSDIVGSSKSVHVDGGLSDHQVALIQGSGGILLTDGDGWRVVGLEAEMVQDLVGPEVALSVVPASFEETFVSLSR